MPGDWSVDPFAEHEPPEECCADGTCPICQVKEVGARVMLGHIGEPGVEPGVGCDAYDALTDEQRAHFRELAGEVMGVMSEALIELGLVKEPTDAPA